MANDLVFALQFQTWCFEMNYFQAKAAKIFADLKYSSLTMKMIATKLAEILKKNVANDFLYNELNTFSLHKHADNGNVENFVILFGHF